MWNPDHPVLSEMRRRRDDPDSPVDARVTKVGLAIEGGGMRGVISAAMLNALEDLGFSSVFDAVYGSSSGAVNGAYFIAGDTWYNLSIYYDNLCTRRFVSMRRFLVGRPILDLDYAFRQVVQNDKPLDWQRVLQSRTSLKIAIADVRRVETYTATDFTSKTDLIDALTASAWLPFASPGTFEYRGRDCLDGGLLTPHAYRLALADGCTHVLSLSTRPVGSWRRNPRVWSAASGAAFNRRQPGLGSAYRRSLVQRSVDQRWLDAARLSDADNGAAVLDLCPLQGRATMARHEGDQGTVLAEARAAYAVAYKALTGGMEDDAHRDELQVIPRLLAVMKEDRR